MTTCPFVPIDDKDEDSSFSILLMHTPWPLNGEQDIIPPGHTAVTILQQFKDNGELPTYVMPMLLRQLTSSNITANQGVPITRPQSNDEEDDIDEIQGECDTLTQFDDDNDIDYQTTQVGQSVNYDGIMTNITERQSEIYRNFIRRSQENYMAELAIVNQIIPSGNTSGLHPQSNSPVENYEERLKKLT